MERTRKNRSGGFRCGGRSAIILSALVFGAGGAGAAPLPAETTLLLGVDRDGKQEPALLQTVSEHLGHNGESVVANPRLSSKDRECKGPECLDAIAAREHARYILSLSVQTNAPGTFVILGTLYDAERHLPYQLPRPAVCDCSPTELVSRLGQVADELFKEYRRRPTSAAVVSPEPPTPSAESPTATHPTLTRVPPVPGTKQPPTSGFLLSPTRKVIAGVIGGGAVVTLATAIGLTALDGSLTSAPCGSTRAIPQCIWDTRTPYGVLYGATAALVIGLGITLFLPDGEKAKVTSPSTPATTTAAHGENK